MGARPKKTKSNLMLTAIKEQDPDESPSKDRTSRFAVDRLIRDYGYRIYQRNEGEALWIKHNVILGQEEILESLDKNEVSDAEYEEMLADCVDNIFREEQK